MAKLLRVHGGIDRDAYAGAIAEAARVIRAGGLVGFPTETVYGLAADALDPAAVARVYEVKDRPLDNALILHLADAGAAASYARSMPAAAPVLMDAFWPGPLTLILPRADVVPEITAGGRDNIAMRIPDHSVARDLIQAVGRPVVGPSANLSGRPSPMTAQDVLDDLGALVDLVLDAGPTQLGIESTVLDLTVSPPAILRPGSVTLEQLRPYLNDVVVGSAAAQPVASSSSSLLRSPTAGLALPDHPPRRPSAMRLVLLDMEPGEHALAEATAIAERHAAAGRRVGLLALEPAARAVTPQHADDHARLPTPIRAGEIRRASLGPAGDLRMAAARLYPALRSLESAGCEILVAAPLPRQGLGLAIMNRLDKAATEVVTP